MLEHIEREAAPVAREALQDRNARVYPRIAGVGTANPAHSYSQSEVLDLFNIEDRRTRLMFMSGAIDRRFLSLPEELPEGGRRVEKQGDLLSKHRKIGVEIGANAIRASLEQAGATLADVRHLCCVTTTGLLTPGLSALLLRELGLRPDCSRLDIVGMGCNAGLNGLSAVSAWAERHPGELAVMLCVEICSAAYVFDGNIETTVVNSLFGDGASAAVVVADRAARGLVPQLLKFASVMIPEAIDAMRFEWDEGHGKFSFLLERDVPYVVGANVEGVIASLLAGTGLRRSDIAHWIVHSGGKKVIDSVKINLSLEKTDLRHTMSVLRDFGNVSSGSFLFSYERLQQEGKVAPGDYGVMMTMGPGATIEVALLHWSV